MSEPGDSLNDFGLVIAFVLPGLTFLLGCSFFHHEYQSWAVFETLNTMSIAGLVFLVLLAVAAGLLVQTIRWLLIDTLNHLTGIKPGDWDFSKLPNQLTAFDGLTENHYRFYQFYAGMVVSLVWLLVAKLLSDGIRIDLASVAITFTMCLFYLGARDTLAKYYTRVDHILSRQ